MTEQLSLEKCVSLSPDDDQWGKEDDLLNAYKNGDLEKFKKILNKGNCNPDFVYSGEKSKRLIDKAAAKGRLQEMEALIAAGAELNKVNPVRLMAPVHYAAKRGQLESLKVLVKHGVDVNIMDCDQATALHYLARKKWRPEEEYTSCIEFLLSQPNLKLNVPDCNGFTAIHTAVEWDAIDAVKLLLNQGTKLNLDSFQAGPKKTTARADILLRYPDLKSDLPQPQTVNAKQLFDLLIKGLEDRFIQQFKIAMNNKTQQKLLSQPARFKRFFNSAFRHGYSQIVQVLLDHADAKVVDLSFDDKFALVRQACKGRDAAMLQVLLRYFTKKQLNVNTADEVGQTLLHYAVEHSDDNCVRLLLKYGAYIGAKDKGLKTPLMNINTTTLSKYLDDAIETNDSLQRDDNYKWIIDYRFLTPPLENPETVQPLQEVKVPLTEETHLKCKKRGQSVPEIGTLLYMSRHKDLRQLLTHPVLRTFIFLKWQRIQRFYYVNLLFYSIFCALLTIYILFGYRAAPHAVAEESSTEIANDNLTSYAVVGNITDYKDLHFVVDLVRGFLIPFLIYITCREIFQLCIQPRTYLSSPENYMEVVLIIISTFVVIKDCSKEFVTGSWDYLWCPQFCAVAILISWFELVLLIGKHPLLSLNIEMFKTVSLNFLKFLAWYAILIVAFALSFYTLFRGCGNECSDTNPFTNPVFSIFKTIVMLTGEFEANDIPFFLFIGTSHLIFTAFVFLIAIVLFNLLNGLAVSDTQAIRDDAILYSAIAQVKVISQIENIFLGQDSALKIHILKLRSLLPCIKTFYLNFSRRITLFPDFMSQKYLFVFPNKDFVLQFEEDWFDFSNQSCCRSTRYFMEPSCASEVQNILQQRLSESKEATSDSALILEKLTLLEARFDEIEKKMELQKIIKNNSRNI